MFDITLESILFSKTYLIDIAIHFTTFNHFQDVNFPQGGGRGGVKNINFKPFAY